jgi:phosphoribosylaminoimidazolecarboxamide formyltransferase / IMP cyclohydrolase
MEWFFLKIKRALLSVYDKTGIVEFARVLSENGVELVSTGGTHALLKKNGLSVTEVSHVTGFPEMLEGRVKTLHPKIHAGILSKQNHLHMEQMKKEEIKTFDLVCVNLYPFREMFEKKLSQKEMIEYIDIGGPAMIRAAAKNFERITVITSPSQYGEVAQEIKKTGSVSIEKRKELSAFAFSVTAEYDSFISAYMNREIAKTLFPSRICLPFSKISVLRYGENPHQKAAAYRGVSCCDSIMSAVQLQGKELSFNNYNDSCFALELIKEFEEPACAIIKHVNPCGVAQAENVFDAFSHALECDSESAFGGIIAMNRECDKRTAEKIVSFFNEIIIAPGYSESALSVFSRKKNLRVIKAETGSCTCAETEPKFIEGGLLLQEKDSLLFEKLDCVTKKIAGKELKESFLFAFKVVKHCKSNAIVLVQGTRTVGLGLGQTSRVRAVKQAIEMAGEKSKGAVLASDAFFPFPDSVEIAANAGISAIIQPGGSMKDKEVIAKANEKGLPMVFTGTRHFKH